MGAKILAIVPAAAMVLALAASSQRATAGAGADVKHAFEAFLEAWNRHDAKAMTTSWHDEGDWIGASGHLASGRNAVEEMLSQTHGPGGAFRNSRLLASDKRARFPTSEVAVFDANVVLVDAFAPEGSKRDPESLYVTSIWKRSSDAWRIYAWREVVFRSTWPGLPRDRGVARTPEFKSDLVAIKLQLHRRTTERGDDAHTVIQLGKEWEAALPKGGRTGNREADAARRTEYDRAFAALEEQLRKRFRAQGNDPEVKGEISAQPDVPHADVIRALDAFLAVGIKQVNFEGALSPGR